MSGYGGPDDDAINAQAMVDNYIDLALSQLPMGESSELCVCCGSRIPERRRLALKGVKHCIPCQEDREKVKVKIKTVTYML